MSRHAPLQRAKASAKESGQLSIPVSAQGQQSTAQRLLGLQSTIGNRAFGQLLSLARQAVVVPSEQDGLPPVVAEVVHPIVQELARSLIEPRFGADFSRIPVHTKAPEGESARPADSPSAATNAALRVTQPTDASEREAEKVADAVVGGDSMLVGGTVSTSRSVSAGTACGLQRVCEKCQEEEQKVARAATPETGQVAPSVVHDVLASPGRPLDSHTRNYFEPSFGHDFSAVRVHDDAAAAQSAEAVRARAYTAGDQIVFNTGEFAPGSAAGHKLLAHELAHVVQQVNDPAPPSLQRQVEAFKPVIVPKKEISSELSDAPPGSTPMDRALAWVSANSTIIKDESTRRSIPPVFVAGVIVWEGVYNPQSALRRAVFGTSSGPGKPHLYKYSGGRFNPANWWAGDDDTWTKAIEEEKLVPAHETIAERRKAIASPEGAVSAITAIGELIARIAERHGHRRITDPAVLANVYQGKRPSEWETRARIKDPREPWCLSGEKQDVRIDTFIRENEAQLKRALMTE